MNTAVFTAALICFVLAIGHTIVGMRWVLPGLRAETLPTSPFGGRALTLDALVFVWHLVTLTVVTVGVLLAILASRPLTADGEIAVRAVGALFAGASITVLWVVRHRPAHLARAPVWVVFVVVAALCWLGT